MGSRGIVVGPDGRGWRVGRRLVDRPFPKLAKRFFHGDSLGHIGEPTAALDLSDGLAVAVVVLVLSLVVVFIVLPLLGVALEIVLFLLVVIVGLLARFLTLRPWAVEAVPLDGGERVVRNVRGWRRSGEEAAALRREIEIAGRPGPTA